jgi:hypothetical protein
MGLFTLLFLPETKGVPIEAVDELFRKHWFWGKVRGAGHPRLTAALTTALTGVLAAVLAAVVTAA